MQLMKETKNKIEQALSLYNYDISDEEVKEAVRKIIAEKVPENDTLEVKKFLMGSVELTTLKDYRLGRERDGLHGARERLR